MPIRVALRSALDQVAVLTGIRRRRPASYCDNDRYSYQVRFHTFDIGQSDRVLDIGSGGYPFPHASVLADRFFEPTHHRHEALNSAGKPVVLADIGHLPFGDKSFDFVYCSHVLEHVDEPIAACQEIMRVGKRGYIETPTMGKDVLFAWAQGMHKWHVVAIAGNLCFFEYTERQLQGIRSPAWQRLVLGRWYHPLQEAFYENQDLFNVMFEWLHSFSVFVFYLNGKVQTCNVEVSSSNALSHQ